MKEQFVYYIVDAVNKDGLYPFAGQVTLLPNQVEFPLRSSECRMMVPGTYNDQDD